MCEGSCFSTSLIKQVYCPFFCSRSPVGCEISHCGFLSFFFFLAMLHSLWDLSSLTRDRTGVLDSGNRILTTGPPGNTLVVASVCISPVTDPSFYVLTGHLYTFFEEMTIQIHCFILIKFIFNYLPLCCWIIIGSLYILDTRLLLDTWLENICSILWIVFSLSW